jgi:hypothetical protein
MSHRDTPELRDGQKLTAQTAREAPSKTPRTDAEEIDLSESIKVELQSTGRRRVVEKYVTAKFARQLEIELSQERERGRWIPVSKKLPEEGATVLAFWHPMSGGPPTGQSWGVTTYCPGHWHNPEDDEDDYATPSHWQPLPSAPK